MGPVCKYVRLDTNGTNSTRDLYEQFIDIISLPILGDSLPVELLRKHELTDSIILKHYFSEEEIRHMIAVLQWIHVLMIGDLANAEMTDNGFEELKKFLGVDDIFAVLHPKGMKGKSVEEAVLFTEKSINVLYKSFIKRSADSLLELVNPENLSSNIEFLFRVDEAETLAALEPALQSLPQEVSFNWTLFVSIVTAFVDEFDTKKSFLEQAAPWLSELPEALHPVITRLEEYVKSQMTDVVVVPKSKPTIIPCYKQPVRFTRPSNVGLPNDMYNGKDTCYISTTLWALAFVMPDKVMECIKKFDKKIAPTEEIQAARESFIRIFTQLRSETTEIISACTVNEFRRSMRKAFPFHFSETDPVAQEDAYQFLSCVLDHLLLMDYGKGIFFVSRLFTRPNPDVPLVDPDLYNYKEQLAPHYAAEPSCLLTIRLPTAKEEGVTFSDLATKSHRSTEILQRTVKQTTNSDKPATQEVAVYTSDQYVLPSVEDAPEVVICTLARFDLEHAAAVKRRDVIEPSLELSFHVMGEPGTPSDTTVTYDLVAVTVHTGTTLHRGHYVNYMRYGADRKIIKYCDLSGPSVDPKFEDVRDHTSRDSYILYYKRRV